MVINNQIVNGTSFTIPQWQLVKGHEYRITVSATVGSNVTWDERTFWISPPPPQTGINVTVTNSLGRPISNALVQFVNNAGTVISYRTNASGMALFPNAPVQTYGINVTHPNFASTSATSMRLSRTNATHVQSVTIVMTEASSGFRSLGWGLGWGPGWAHVLEGMGTVANPTYRISSVYGYRAWGGRALHAHNGVDIVMHTGVSEGRRVNSPFEGTVVHIYRNTGAAGYGIVLSYFDYDSGTEYFVRFLHLQHHPRRLNNTNLAAGNTVTAGEHVGRLGNTGDSSGAHLHMDVHRNFDPTVTGNFSRSVDPRVFFADGLIRQWNGLNIQ